jgi:pyruvate, water dikinase
MAHPLPASPSHSTIHQTFQSGYVIDFKNLRMTDVAFVGGKNASLGEMISQLSDMGVRVPGGFATTAQAFQDFLSFSMNEGPSLAQRIRDRLAALDVSDVRALAEAGEEIRRWIIETPFPPRLEEAIVSAYQQLSTDSQGEMSFAIR